MFTCFTETSVSVLDVGCIGSFGIRPFPIWHCGTPAVVGEEAFEKTVYP